MDDQKEIKKNDMGGEIKEEGCMGYVVGKVHLCTDIDSPEMILLIIVPLITAYIFLTNNFPYGLSILISVIYGILIYALITVIKNIIALIIKSDSSCKIPELNKSF